MKITIKGSAKEIAALALELQGRQPREIGLSDAREIVRMVKKYEDRVNPNQVLPSSAETSVSSCAP